MRPIYLILCPQCLFFLFVSKPISLLVWDALPQNSATLRVKPICSCHSNQRVILPANSISTFSNSFLLFLFSFWMESKLFSAEVFISAILLNIGPAIFVLGYHIKKGLLPSSKKQIIYLLIPLRLRSRVSRAGRPLKSSVTLTFSRRLADRSSFLTTGLRPAGRTVSPEPEQSTVSGEGHRHTKGGHDPSTQAAHNQPWSLYVLC